MSPDGTTCEINQPPAIQALTFIKGLFDQGIAPSPQQLNQQGQGSEQIFLSGRGAMLIGNGRWAAYDLQSVTRFGWAMAPLPQGPAGRANFFHLSMFAIASNSQNQSEAWQFLQFMLSKRGIETTVGNAQGVPSIASMVKDPAFTSSPIVVGHETVKPMLESLPTAHRAPDIANFNPSSRINSDDATGAKGCTRKPLEVSNGQLLQEHPTCARGRECSRRLAPRQQVVGVEGVT